MSETDKAREALSAVSNLSHRIPGSDDYRVPKSAMVAVDAALAMAPATDATKLAREALAPFASPKLTTDEDGDALEMRGRDGRFCLPDSHGFQLTWADEDDGDTVHITAGQIRRARAAYADLSTAPAESVHLTKQEQQLMGNVLRASVKPIRQITPAENREKRTDGWGTLPFPADTKALQRLCACWHCIGERREWLKWFVVCPKCGHKRCPKAIDHRYRCTGSNALNQIGEITVAEETSND